MQVDRLDVGAIGDGRVGHDGGGVAVEEHNAEAVGAEGLAGLCAGVIELAGLTDNDGAGADDEDGVEVGAARHGW